MFFLINASNLKQGGGIQVTQSICGQLCKYKKHHFIVVLSTYVDDSLIEFGENVKVVKYNVQNTLLTLLFGRDNYLDALVKAEKIDAVLTVFGPSRWRPKVTHLCGFARAQLLIGSQFKVNNSWWSELKQKLIFRIWTWSFKKSSNIFYTENSFISDMLPGLLGRNIKVYTVTNYYNQVFDQPQKWKKTIKLTDFEGTTCLSVSTHYPHKNFEILIDVVKYLQQVHPDFKVRFVLTFDRQEMLVPETIKNAFVFIGKVGVEECPYLYEQCDIMFMPTLMECFTATYPEAMRMEVPIVTTDLEFANGLCGDAACYYSAVDAVAAAEAIYKVAMEKAYANQLVANGKKQLLKYDNYEQRSEKLVKILEEISKTN